MRVMILVKASAESEAGGLPDTEMLDEMSRYNEELAKAGVMLAGEGLRPSSKGVRVRFTADGHHVTEGPFDSSDLVAGFWLWRVSSMDEAIDWLKRAPFRDGELEIRQIAEAEDFGEAFTPELRAREERLRSDLARG